MKIKQQIQKQVTFTEAEFKEKLDLKGKIELLQHDFIKHDVVVVMTEDVEKEVE